MCAQVLSLATLRWEPVSSSPSRPSWSAAADDGGGGESFLRVHWVAVPKAMRARRVNRRRAHGGGAEAAGAAAHALRGAGGSHRVQRVGWQAGGAAGLQAGTITGGAKGARARSAAAAGVQPLRWPSARSTHSDSLPPPPPHLIILGAVVVWGWGL
jgi:hypothetical protein